MPKPAQKTKVRAKSIARRLNFALISRKFLKTLVIDVVAIVIIMAVWCVAVEKQNIGDGGHIRNRRFEGSLNIEKSIDYLTGIGNEIGGIEGLTEDEVKTIMKSHLPFSGIYYCFDVTSNEIVYEEGNVEAENTGVRFVYTEIGFRLEEYAKANGVTEIISMTDYAATDIPGEYVSPDETVVTIEDLETRCVVFSGTDVIASAEKVPNGKRITFNDNGFTVEYYNIIDGLYEIYKTQDYTKFDEGYFSPNGDVVTLEEYDDYCVILNPDGTSESISRTPAAIAAEIHAEINGTYTGSEMKFTGNTLSADDGIKIENTTHVRVSAAVILTLLCVIFILFFVFQLLEFIIGTFSGSGIIRRYLKPIDDIAIMAEKLSSAESQTQQVSREEVSEVVKRKIKDAPAPEPEYDENGTLIDDTDITTAELSSLAYAIDSIDDSKKRIDVHDTELSGLEAAVNNMLRRLEEAKRKQIRFVDDASHELRTPIAVIQGYVNMLDRWGKDDPAIMDEAITAIKNESEHMKTLIDQLLFLARGEMDRHVLEKRRVNAGIIMEEIYDESILLEAELPEQSRHEFSAEALYVTPEDPNLPQLTENPTLPDNINPPDPTLCEYYITADEAMIKQSVRILRDNAMRYTPPGGRISFKVYERADTTTGQNKVCLEVSDTGIGIPKSELPRIFDRFYRGTNARANNTGGSGLGLSIARWITEEHGGAIEAVSGSGFGTKMTIVLDECREEQ